MRNTALYIIAAGLIGILEPTLCGQSKPAMDDNTITWLMPLERGAERLQQRYGKVVTYEDPMREWAGDLDPNAPGAPFSRIRPHSLKLPEGVLSVDAATGLRIETVRNLVDAYHQQNPEGAHFKVLESPLGFHIVPVQVRNAKGALTAVTSPLDAQIEVPVQSRTAQEHLDAIADAASKATGIHVMANNGYFDNYFGANRYLPRRPDYLPEDRQYMVIDWGASHVTARDALIHLLLLSCSTQTWSMNCRQARPGEGTPACFLNMDAVSTGQPLRPLYDDRCKDMRKLPDPQSSGR